MVVPFPPGGSVDIMARQYSEPLSRVLGVPIVVETVRCGWLGGCAIRGACQGRRLHPGGVVAKQPSGQPADPAPGGLRPGRDFENIAILGRLPNALVVHSSLPFKTFKEFIDYAKKNPASSTTVVAAWAAWAS